MFSGLIAVYGLVSSFTLAWQPRPWPTVGAASGKSQQLPPAVTRALAPRPQAERVGAPQAGVGEAKPSPEAPARPVQPGPRRASCGSPGTAPRSPAAATLGAGGPAPYTTPRARGWHGVGCARAPVGGAQVAIVANPGSLSIRGPWDRSSRARGPRLLGAGAPHSTAPAPACGGFGEGGPARSGTVTQPQRNRRVGTCRPGGRGRRRPRYGLAPPGPGLPRASRPALRCAPRPARPEGAGWLERPRRLSQGR